MRAWLRRPESSCLCVAVAATTSGRDPVDAWRFLRQKLEFREFNSHYWRMRYRSRVLESRVLESLQHFPVVVIQGARQAGKSTMVQHLGIEGLSTVTFDPVQDIGGARQDPDFFLQNTRLPAFLDEIQYAPELTGSIKRLVDKRRENGLFILSGSQNLSVLRSVSESMAGRAAVLDLLPMCVVEMEERSPASGILTRLIRDREWTPEDHRASPPRSLYERLWRGGMPGLLDIPDHLVTTYFDSYQRTYVERDVRTAADIRSLLQFGRFLGLLAALTGQEINHNQLGRELGIDRKTALSWTEVATATFQWHQVPPCATNPIKRIAGKPKGYFADTGFACALQRITSPEVLSRHPMTGALFETHVFLEISKLTAVWPARPAVSHYRAYSGGEVDLVLELDGVLHPVETKMTSQPTRAHCSGFDSLRRTFPHANIGTGLLVCAVEQPRRLREDVIAVPWWEL